MARQQFIEITYSTLKRFHENEISKSEAIQSLANDGMNPGSAIINVNVFYHLMKGDKFTRTLSAPTFDYFFSQISNDFGISQLRTCLDGLAKHIDYMESTRNYKMGKVRKIYDKYQISISAADDDFNDEEIEFPEGREKYRLHRYKERNRRLVLLAKQKFKATDPEMKCQVCKFSFGKKYGQLGVDFIEAHHVFPISQLKEETPIKIEDLAMVCSNCHRMLHIKRPWLNIDELKNIGCDTAKSVLDLPIEDLVRRTDLEEETIKEVIRILRSEFE